MKRNSMISRFYPAVIISLTALSGWAQIQTTNTPIFSSETLDANFRRGWHEASFGAGGLFANVVRASNRPNIDYAVAYAQASYTVIKPAGGGLFRGSFDLTPEIFGGGIYQDQGHYVAGATLWFRYNFVQPGSRFVPYIEGGGGGTFLDIPKRFDGKIYNFNLDAAVGVRYFIRPQLSLNAEYRLQHISNADLWDHNIGVNTSGPFAGMSLFF
jgi:lipid A 3-O-deacylase